MNLRADDSNGFNRDACSATPTTESKHCGWSRSCDQ